MNGLLLLIAAMVLVQTPAAASAPADPLKEFLAHYAKIDQEIKTFRASVNVVIRIPKGHYDDNVDIAGNAPRPVPAKDTVVSATMKVTYSKALPAIFRQVTKHTFNWQTSEPRLVREVHAYDGRCYLFELLAGSAHQKTDSGNSRTENIMEPSEAPLMWMTGRLWMREIAFHREVAQSTWSYVGTSPAGLLRFKAIGGPRSYALVDVDDAHHWRIVCCDFFSDGKLASRISVSEWGRTSQGIEYPKRWERQFLLRNRIFDQVEHEVTEVSFNDELTLADFKPVMPDDITTIVVRDGQFTTIEPNASGFRLLAVLAGSLALFAIAILFLRRRFTMSKRAVPFVLILSCALMSAPQDNCEYKCKAVTLLCLASNDLIMFEHTHCRLGEKIWAQQGSNNLCEAMGSQTTRSKTFVFNITCDCPNRAFPKEGLDVLGDGSLWSEPFQRNACTKTPAGSGLNP